MISRSIVYATQTCSRCDGSGRYSWNARDGDRCFGCSGRGTSVTKAARASRDLVDARKTELLGVDVADVRVGDLVRLFPEVETKVRRVSEVELRDDAEHSVCLRTPTTAGPSGVWFSDRTKTRIVQRKPTAAEWTAICDYAATLPGVTIAEKEVADPAAYLGVALEGRS